jgi:hypothetical protein
MMTPSCQRLLAGAVFLLSGAAYACGGSVAGDAPPPSGPIRIVSAPTTGTVDELLSQPITVEVPGHEGSTVILRAARRPGPTGVLLPTAIFTQAGGAFPRFEDTLRLGANDRASAFVRLGTVATSAAITVLVPALSDSLQFSIVVKPGATVGLTALPKDTALYVGRSFVLRMGFVDGYGNVSAASGGTFAGDSSAATVAGSGEVDAHAIGRARFTVRNGALTDTAWVSVVPSGRIAAVHIATQALADTTKVVLVNLDGSGYREFPLQLSDVPAPAWHSTGAYVISPLHPPPGSSDGFPRLAALDTTSGQWSPTIATGSTPVVGRAAFSRDGSWIFAGVQSVASDRDVGASSMFRFRTDGSGAPEIVGYPADHGIAFTNPSPSPDGTRIAMMATYLGSQFTLVTPVAPPLGDSAIAGMRSLPTGGWPVWSPVSDTLIMFGDEGMWLMATSGRQASDRRYISQDVSAQGFGTTGGPVASWSPDGKWTVTRSSTTLILIEVATNRVLPLGFASRLVGPAWRPH